jgi:hypothetical protein
MKMAKASKIMGGPGDFYLAHKQEVSEASLEVIIGARQFWEPEFGPERTQVMAQQAGALFD